MQSWSGLPRVTRLNATHVIIYKTGDLKQLKQIYENFATYVTFEEFMKVYRQATQYSHSFAKRTGRMILYLMEEGPGQ